MSGRLRETTGRQGIRDGHHNPSVGAGRQSGKVAARGEEATK